MLKIMYNNNVDKGKRSLEGWNSSVWIKQSLMLHNWMHVYKHMIHKSKTIIESKNQKLRWSLSSSWLWHRIQLYTLDIISYSLAP